MDLTDWTKYFPGRYCICLCHYECLLQILLSRYCGQMRYIDFYVRERWTECKYLTLHLISPLVHWICTPVF